MTGAEPAHLDLDALADALAGQEHEHLRGCASCAGRLSELQAAEATVVAALRALPDPPVPDDLAARLSRALAAEPPLAARRSSVTALPERATGRRLLPAAAAAVLLLSGTGLGYALLQGGGADESADTAGLAAGGATADLVTSSSGTDYADTAAVTGALPSVLAGTAQTFALDSAAGSVAGSAESRSADAGASDPSRSAALPAPAAATAPDPLERLRTPAGLADCLFAVLPPEEPDLRPLALDYAQYEGQPALAVMLPDPDPAKVSVYVVGAGCAAADAQLLGFLRVDAP